MTVACLQLSRKVAELMEAFRMGVSASLISSAKTPLGIRVL